MCVRVCVCAFAGMWTSRGRWWGLRSGTLQVRSGTAPSQACKLAPPWPFPCMAWVKLQALVYNTLPPTTAIIGYAIGLEKLPANDIFSLMLEWQEVCNSHPKLIRHLFYNHPCYFREHTQKKNESRGNSFLLPEESWLCACLDAVLLPQSYLCYQYPNLWARADNVGGQLRGDKDCSFGGVSISGRVWRKVPESEVGVRALVWNQTGNKCEGPQMCYFCITRRFQSLKLFIVIAFRIFFRVVWYGHWYATWHHSSLWQWLVFQIVALLWWTCQKGEWTLWNQIAYPVQMNLNNKKINQVRM